MNMHRLIFAVACSVYTSHGRSVAVSYERSRNNLRKHSSSQLRAVGLNALARDSSVLNGVLPLAMLFPPLVSFRAGWDSPNSGRWHLLRSPRNMALHAGHRHGRHFLLMSMNNKSKDVRKQATEPAPLELPEDYQRAFEDGLRLGRNISLKFFRPRIDDPGLPPSDGLVSINGALLVAVLARLGYIPMPTWLQPVLPPGQHAIGSLPYVLPAINHGSRLALCWLLGALASGAFESEAYVGTLGEAIARTWKGGLFATGVLVLSTQLYISLQLLSQGIDPTDPANVNPTLILTTIFEVTTNTLPDGTPSTSKVSCGNASETISTFVSLHS